MSHQAPPPPLDDDAPEAPLTRRTALWLTSRLAMVAGLVGGYGLFAWVGGRFMLPAHTGRLHQLFVTRVSDVPDGGTLLYRTPDGRTVNGDIHADTEYRTAMAAIYTRRAIEGALARLDE